MQTPLYDTRVLVAAGTAAGFAAAYNTPFAAVLFVLETIVGIAALEAMLPMMFSSMLAAFLTRTVVGGGPLYGQRAFALTSPAELLSYAALGCVAAGLGIAFKKALAICERAFERQALVQPWRAVAGGLIVGLIAVAVPDVAGNGYEPLNLLLDHPFGSTAIVLLMVAKMAATSSAVASGVPGGIFTPSLLVGGAAGVLWARVAAPLFMPATPDAGSCALVGMAAMTAAITHAPLTAAVMIFEVSGDYPVVLPLMLATVAATAVSRRLRSDSVYQAEHRPRGLEWRVTHEGRQVVDDVPG
jgi:CIC family chloride channel protein